MPAFTHVTLSLAPHQLRRLGAEVYEKSKDLDWDCLAGYDAVRQEVEDSVVLALKHPDTYERIARSTRQR